MSVKQNKAVLFTNGDFPGAERLVNRLGNDDFLVAVDGGLSHMTRHNLCPDLIIGDLDSANPGDVSLFEAQGVDIRKFPQDKNETDLELALEAVLEMNLHTIWITAAFGNRLDQTLGNIFLLARGDLAKVDIRLIDGHQEVFLIRQSTSIIGEPGQRVSLLPLGSPVYGIHTKGLIYPLVGETLFPDRTRGISNRMNSTTASIAVQQGLLICIHEMIE
ncbi:MAG: thiamine diphosphokinase [Chloroflexota bacterium]|nr:thiamine diphosphokinase [Chloroflexota bacterium]